MATTKNKSVARTFRFVVKVTVATADNTRQINMAHLRERVADMLGRGLPSVELLPIGNEPITYAAVSYEAGRITETK